jgi:alpha-tubulin suppressor-like RCC1 family protein
MDVLATLVRKPSSRAPLLALALALGAGCGGDDGGPTDPQTGSISISLSPTSVSLVQGESGTTTVMLTRSGGFTGAVELSLEGAPGGVTETFSPATIAPGATSSTLTLAAVTTTPGTYNLTVRARADGVSDRTAALALTVAPAPSPDFVITLQPGRVGVIQGREASAAVTIERLGGFARQVTLSVQGAPAGMTATVVDDTVIHVSLGRYVHVGDHTLTVTGVSGSLTRTAELEVRVFQSRPVAAAWSYSLAVADDGSLWSWGRNHQGQLGLGHTTDQNSPVRVGADTNWVAVAGGNGHSIALKSDGSLWVAGDNGYGQLGIPGSHRTFQRVGSDNDWVAVAAGDYHTLAIKADRSLWAWGRNRFGQLGTGNVAQQNTPVRIAGNDWVQVAGAADHTVAIKADGTLWTWGDDSYGQLGTNPGTSYVTLPQQVGTANDWLLASAGVNGGATVAIKTNRTLWGWGRNISGELGLGPVTGPTSPQQLSQANDWIDVSTGSGFTIALKANGTLWSSGANSRGRLGTSDPDGYNRYEFGQALGVGWRFVSAGEGHTLAIGPGDALFAWGSNQFGELGHGTSDIQGNGPVPGFKARWP